MKKILLTCLIFFFASSCGSQEASTIEVEDYEQIIFNVRTRTCDAGLFKNSIAVSISENYLVTVAHVFDDAESYELKNHSGEIIPANVVALDTNKDLAILELATPVKSFANLKPIINDLETANLIQNSGSEISIKKIKITKISDVSFNQGDPKKSIEIAENVETGDSGSPLLYDGLSLAGIVFATDSKGENRSWAIDSSEILEVLDFEDPSDFNLQC